MSNSAIMKKHILVYLFILSSVVVFSQGFNWTFYSENKESFTLFIDGSKMNSSPQPRVVAQGIKGVFKTIRIEFQDTRLPHVTKRIPLRPGLKELTTAIKQNSKGEYILRNIDGSPEETQPEVANNNPSVSPTETSVPPAQKEKSGFGTRLLQKTTSFGKNVASAATGGSSTSNSQPIQTDTSIPESKAQSGYASVPQQQTSNGSLTAKFDGETITLNNGKSYIVKRERDQSGMNGPQVIMKAPEGAPVTITQDGGKEVYNGDVPFIYTVKDWNYYNTYFKLEVTEGNQKWSVKMQNGTGYRFVIEQGQGSAKIEETVPTDQASNNPSTSQYSQPPSQYTKPSNEYTQPNTSREGQPYGANQGGSGTWIIYTEMGENFTLFLDGQRINSNPQSSVTTPVTGISKQIRLEFENSAIPKILKRYPVVGGGETTIMVKQKKKGEYVTRIVSAPRSATSMPDMEEVKPTNAPQSSEPLTAKYDGETITLSNGKSYSVKRERDQSGMEGPQVIMKAPEGATVTITQDGGTEIYNGEVPFVYTVKDWNFNNSYFKLEVTEGKQKWFVKMQNGTGYRLVITD